MPVLPFIGMGMCVRLHVSVLMDIQSHENTCKIFFLASIQAFHVSFCELAVSVQISRDCNFSHSDEY